MSIENLMQNTVQSISHCMVESPSRRIRNAGAPTAASSTTIRRLSDTDVRSIFECLHHNMPPPTNLHFTIVPVGPNGMKLSPPSYEFADGLYVLLRPVRKYKKRQELADAPRAPVHLQHLTMENIPPETCPWSLSGPQFPQPTAIQQRYCYPKGRPEYSSRKGGALWTMYGADGKEDVEFRLLHVYFSAKRAINKGMSSIAENEPIYYPKSTPSQPLDRVASKRLRASPQRAQPQPHQNQFLHSPAITTSSANSTSLSGSPLSFDVLPPCASPNYSENTGENSNSSSTIYPTWPEQLIVTPINDLLPRHPHSPVQRQANHADSSEESSYAGRLTPSPFRLPIRTPPSTINVTNSPLLRTGEYTVPLPGDDFDFYEAESVSSHDAFHNEALDFPLQHEIDSFWNDPFMTIMLKPSHDADFRSGDDLATEQLEDSFSSRLDVLQDSIRDRILAAPESRQPKLVSLMASWARKMADDPLAKSTMSHTTAVPSHRASKNDDENDESYSYEPTVDDGSDDKPTASGF